MTKINDQNKGQRTKDKSGCFCSNRRNVELKPNDKAQMTNDKDGSFCSNRRNIEFI